MSSKSVSIVDRPPEGGAGRGEFRQSFKRASFILGSALLLLASSAVAQDHPRIDPGTPPPTPGGASDGWEILAIPGLPAGAILGDVWAAPNGDIYLWANVPPRVRSNTIEEPVEGERLPNPPGDNKQAWSSTVYRFDGTNWTHSMQAPGEIGIALMGAGDEVFASTTSQQGEARLYHLRAGVWVREELPGQYLGRLHTIVGEANDLYFKIDRVVLHYDGARLSPVFELPSDESAECGMVDLGPDALFVMSGDCHFLLHNGEWSCVEAGFDFGHVENAWGMREANGRLQMYAIGDDGDNSGLKVWKFDENDPARHDGIWVPVLLDPMSGHTPEIGSGYHLWGGAGNDVYATGVVMGEGHMMRFDGTTWNQLVPPQALGTIHGVWGGAGGVVWFTAEAGQVVRYQRANSAPDVAATRPSIERLWPADHQLVAVDVLGVTDPEGDPFTMTIDRVLSDENPVTPDVVGNCPDARVVGNRVMLRAEHNPNGDGRTYVIEFTATDRLGLSSLGRVTVCAPHYSTTPCDVDPATFEATGPCVVPSPQRKPFVTGARGSSLQVRYELEAAVPVYLGIYDVAGRLRGVIDEGQRAAGVHETAWDLSGLDAGVYFVKLRTGTAEAITNRVVVLH